MSSNSAETGALLFIITILTYIAVVLGTGKIAWDWIHPNHFWGVIKFLIVWAILGYIAKSILIFIIGIIVTIVQSQK